MLAAQQTQQYEQNNENSVEQVSLTEEELQKVKSSLEATERALFKLRKAFSALDSAKQWGKVDIIVGGIIATSIKRDKINEAKGHLKGANNALDNLHTELSCLADCQHIRFDGIIESNKYLKFGDYLLDSGIIDICVQKEISRGKERCRAAIRKVDELRKILEKQLEEPVKQVPIKPQIPQIPQENQSNDEGNDLTEEEIEKIKRSIEASDKALFKLHKAKKALDKAGKWGIADIFGGGLITTSIKRDYMDESKGHIKGATNAIETLHKELNDLSNCKHIKFDSILDNNKYATFGDYIMDCGIIDIYVQSQISKGKDECRAAIKKVEEIKKLLEKQLEKK